MKSEVNIVEQPQSDFKACYRLNAERETKRVVQADEHVSFFYQPFASGAVRSGVFPRPSFTQTWARLGTRTRGQNDVQIPTRMTTDVLFF